MVCTSAWQPLSSVFRGCFNADVSPVSPDVYSFEEEEAVLDPNISEHLSHFGIDMLQMQQRVKGSWVLFHLSFFLSPIINMSSLIRSAQVLWKLPVPCTDNINYIYIYALSPPLPSPLKQTENGHDTDNNNSPPRARASEWEVIQESASKLKAVYGSGYTGVKNLGNSCYLGSVMQVLFSIPEFQRM